MVLGQQAVDVGAAAADRQRAAGERDPEAVGRLQRHDAAADDVDRLGAQPPVEELDELVPVGVELTRPCCMRTPAWSLRGSNVTRV